MYYVNESDYNLLMSMLENRYKLIVRDNIEKIYFDTNYIYDCLLDRKKKWEIVYKNHNDIIALLPSISEILKKYDTIPFAVEIEDAMDNKIIEKIHVEDFKGELLNRLLFILKKLQNTLFLIEFTYILPQDEIKSVKDEIIELLIRFEAIRLYIVNKCENFKNKIYIELYVELQYDYIYKKIRACILE